MEENSLEKQKIKIDSLKEEKKGALRDLFDQKDELNDRLDTFILQLEFLEKAGFVFNKEEIIRGIKESAGIQDRETFVTYLLRVLEPIIVLKITQPKIFEKILREGMMLNSGNIKLSEVLYVEFENKDAIIHLAPAVELIKEKGIGNFKREVEMGLIKLAEIIEFDDGIKEIWAVSWIVAKTPLAFKKLGFTIVGEISEEEKKEYFSDEKRPVMKAFITRKGLLAKYGNGHRA